MALEYAGQVEPFFDTFYVDHAIAEQGLIFSEHDPYFLTGDPFPADRDSSVVAADNHLITEVAIHSTDFGFLEVWNTDPHWHNLNLGEFEFSKASVVDSSVSTEEIDPTGLQSVFGSFPVEEAIPFEALPAEAFEIVLVDSGSLQVDLLDVSTPMGPFEPGIEFFSDVDSLQVVDDALAGPLPPFFPVDPVTPLPDFLPADLAPFWLVEHGQTTPDIPSTRLGVPVPALDSPSVFTPTSSLNPDADLLRLSQLQSELADFS